MDHEHFTVSQGEYLYSRGEENGLKYGVREGPEKRVIT